MKKAFPSKQFALGHIYSLLAIQCGKEGSPNYEAPTANGANKKCYYKKIKCNKALNYKPLFYL